MPYEKKQWIVHGVLAVVEGTQEVWLNLHDHAFEVALQVVREVLKAAWERGSRRVTIVHGAKEVTSPLQAMWSGRGSIKWSIRHALNSGEYMPWAYYSRSKKHEKDIAANRITLALRPNPHPRAGAPWPVLPDLDY